MAWNTQDLFHLQVAAHSGFWDRGRIAWHFECAGKEEEIPGLPSEVLEEKGEIMFLKVNSQW